MGAINITKEAEMLFSLKIGDIEDLISSAGLGFKKNKVPNREGRQPGA